jgi:hypothetical protein
VISITNTTGGWDLVDLYLAPFGARTWGEDRLQGDSTLTEGDTWTMEVPAGVYSIRVVDVDGDTYTRLSLPVMDTLEWVVTLDDLDGASGAGGASSG